MATYHPETQQKRNLSEFLRKKFPAFLVWRIENSASNAIPDIIIVGNRISSHIEVKFAQPDFKSKGDQELMMNRLYRKSYAFYAVFYEVEKERRTYIVDPPDIGKPLESWSNVRPGFAYDWIGSHVEGIHRGNHTIR